MGEVKERMIMAKEILFKNTEEWKISGKRIAIGRITGETHMSTEGVTLSGKRTVKDTFHY